MLALITSTTAAFVGSRALVLPARAPAASMLAPPVGELPRMYRERWAGEPAEPLAARQAKLDRHAAEVMGALMGVTAMAAVGYGTSSVSVDSSLSMLGAAGMYNEHVLFTDILMRWADSANQAGTAILPLAILYLMQAAPSAYLETAEADLTDLEEEACLIAFEEPVCGNLSFDSADDGFSCVEAYTNGKLRWVCA
jgi:hypothetical protein